MKFEFPGYRYEGGYLMQTITGLYIEDEPKYYLLNVGAIQFVSWD